MSLCLNDNLSKPSVLGFHVTFQEGQSFGGSSFKQLKKKSKQQLQNSSSNSPKQRLRQMHAFKDLKVKGLNGNKGQVGFPEKHLPRRSSINSLPAKPRNLSSLAILMKTPESNCQGEKNTSIPPLFLEKNQLPYLRCNKLLKMVNAYFQQVAGFQPSCLSKKGLNYRHSIWLGLISFAEIS